MLDTEGPLCVLTQCIGCPYQCLSCTLSASLVRTCSECDEAFALSTVDNTCFRSYPAIAIIVARGGAKGAQPALHSIMQRFVQIRWEVWTL